MRFHTDQNAMRIARPYLVTGFLVASVFSPAEAETLSQQEPQQAPSVKFATARTLPTFRTMKKSGWTTPSMNVGRCSILSIFFREHDTPDELGIGSVRDTFADLFFPGTTTIMTRARYFLLVPWTYQRLEKQRVCSAQIA